MVVDDVEMEEEIKPLLPKMLLATVFNTAAENTQGLAGNSIPTPRYALDSSRLNLTFKFRLKYKYRNDNIVVFYSCRSPNASITERVYLAWEEPGSYYHLPGTRLRE